MDSKKRILLIISVTISIPLYIVLHELGHVIVMLSAEARITEFSILHAHVSAVNGSYTNFSDLWLQANGAFLPIVISILYGLFYKKDCKNILYRFLSFFIMLIPLCSMLAWVILPFAYLQGKAPIGDDVTNFLYNFSQDHSPLIVSATAIIIIIIGISIMYYKGIFRNYIDEIKHK